MCNGDLCPSGNNLIATFSYKKSSRLARRYDGRRTMFSSGLRRSEDVDDRSRPASKFRVESAQVSLNAPKSFNPPGERLGTNPRPLTSISRTQCRVVSDLGCQCLLFVGIDGGRRWRL
ncbi:unnamed protein product, partial [Iphiclides podalirius]